MEDFYLQIIHVQASYMEERGTSERPDKNEEEEEMLLEGEVQFNEEIPSD